MSEEKKSTADTTAPLKFRVDNVLFTDIGLNYHDDVAGNQVKLYLGELKTRIKDFDLAKQHYLIKELSLKNTLIGKDSSREYFISKDKIQTDKESFMSYPTTILLRRQSPFVLETTGTYSNSIISTRNKSALYTNSLR